MGTQVFKKRTKKSDIISIQLNIFFKNYYNDFLMVLLISISVQTMYSGDSFEEDDDAPYGLSLIHI